MPELLRIQEPESPMASSTPAKEKIAPSLNAFLELAFRPLYLMGCCWAIVAVVLWVFMPALSQGVLAGVNWHAHEMLWGFVATIATGFLLTAASNWTGLVTIKGRALALLCFFWLVARIGFLVFGPARQAAFWVASTAELLFFLIGGAALARVIYKSRNKRNYGVPILLWALGAADALFLIDVWQASAYTLLMQRFTTGLICMALIALLIGRRVIPFFASRAIPGLDIPMHTKSGGWQMVVSILAILCLQLDWKMGQAVFLSLAGALTLWQVLSWQPWAVRKAPLLWILYSGFAVLGAGLLVAAVFSLGWVQRTAWPAHIIGSGGFAMLIVGMVTRTALGHLGRKLFADRSMVLSFVLVILACILRLIALLPTPMSLPTLHMSTLAWTIAFVIYLWRFLPLMIRPRADAQLQKIAPPKAVPMTK